MSENVWLCRSYESGPQMSEAQVKREISQPEFGLKWSKTIDVLPRRHITVFKRQAVKKSGGR